MNTAEIHNAFLQRAACIVCHIFCEGTAIKEYHPEEVTHITLSMRPVYTGRDVAGYSVSLVVKMHGRTYVFCRTFRGEEVRKLKELADHLREAAEGVMIKVGEEVVHLTDIDPHLTIGLNTLDIDSNGITISNSGEKCHYDIA